MKAMHQINIFKIPIIIKGADVIPDGKNVGSSKVDEFFTYLEEDKADEIKEKYGERFSSHLSRKIAPLLKNYTAALNSKKNGLKNPEFAGLKGKFKLYTVYTDAISEEDDETIFSTRFGSITIPCLKLFLLLPKIHSMLQ